MTAADDSRPMPDADHSSDGSFRYPVRHDAAGPRPALSDARAEKCPYCPEVIRGTLADIDSGLRKHLEYCEAAQAAQRDGD